MKLQTSRRSAFTLLEIMLVVAIIMMLLGLAIYKMRGSLDFGRNAKVTADIESFKTALMMYESTTGALPSTGQGLTALVTQPSGDPKPRHWIQGMSELPLDPWGQPYRYELPGKHNPTSYDIYSAGADRTPGNADDFGNW